MDEDYTRRVHTLVADIPTGRVMTYGLIAEVVADDLRAAGERVRGGPRQVGAVMAGSGGTLPWWRVVNAVGSPPPQHATTALEHLRAEGTPLSADGTRVAVRRAVWFPEV